MGRPRVRVYELSSQNRIMAVSDNWDPFARGNGGAAALAHAVMGRPIWDFVSGVDTRSYLNALFFAARSAGTRVAVRYRGDSAAERRLYHLLIEPQADGALRLSHLPIDIARHMVRAPTAAELASQSCCGQCLRWRKGQTWGASEAFPGLARAPVDYVVCPQCRAEAQRAIDQAMSGRHVH